MKEYVKKFESRNIEAEEIIQKAKVEYRHAMKINNEGLADKVLARLKDSLEAMNYDWKKDPNAIELLSDYRETYSKNNKKVKTFEEFLNENQTIEDEENEPWYDPEWCEDCSTEDEKSGIEYEPNFTWKNGCWHCDRCGNPV